MTEAMDRTDKKMDRTDEEIFNFAYELALRDAVNQTAFNGIGKGSKTRLRGCVAAKRKVKNYIGQIFAGNNPDFYDFAKPVEEAFACYNTEPEHGVFKFGNTQKLINMTAKYMFMATYNRQELRENFKCCHCPMDNQLINKVAKYVGLLVEEYQEITMEAAEEMLKDYAGKRKKIGDWVKLESFGWSKLNSEEGRAIYDTYQETIRFLSSNATILKKHIGVDSPLSPLEFDFYAWGK